jgi:flagellar L-ring protein precursor FlgH
MIRPRSNLVVALAAALLAGGCATTPPTNVHQPMTARPEPLPRLVPHDGAIFNDQSARLLLFNDRRARFVGDTITVLIEERMNATRSASSSAVRAGSIEASAPTVSGLPGGRNLQRIGIDASSSNEFSGRGSTASANTFTGTIATTVIEVFPNGNLLVSGEKQVSVNNQTEFVRFSGVVSPASISAANTVSSTRVADARIESKGTGTISEAQVMGWMARFFLTFLPF